jgi:hypothetical protein
VQSRTGISAKVPTSNNYKSNVDIKANKNQDRKEDLLSENMKAQLRTVFEKCKKQKRQSRNIRRSSF